MAQRQSGTVKWFNDEKGYGFITQRAVRICSCTSVPFRATASKA